MLAPTGGYATALCDRVGAALDSHSVLPSRGDACLPLEPTRGNWKRESLHGRAIVGLLGYELDRVVRPAPMIPARLMVDMFSLPPFEAARIEVWLLKQSGRLRLAEADLLVAGRAVARASGLFLLPTASPPGRIWLPAGGALTRFRRRPAPSTPSRSLMPGSPGTGRR